MQKNEPQMCLNQPDKTGKNQFCRFLQGRLWVGPSKICMKFLIGGCS